MNEYIAAGADLVMSKPLKMAQLAILMNFLGENGPISMGPVSVLSPILNTFEWVENTSTSIAPNGDEWA